MCADVFRVAFQVPVCQKWYQKKFKCDVTIISLESVHQICLLQSPLHRLLHPAPDSTEYTLGYGSRAISEGEQNANIEIVLAFWDVFLPAYLAYFT